MADNKDTKDTIVAVGPGVDDPEDAQAPRRPSEETAAGEGYEYPEDDGHGERAQEERAGHAPEDPESDAQGLNRQQRKRRNQREQRERDRRELSFLRTRNEQLEREQSQRLAQIENRQTQSDMVVIDGRIAQATDQIREAETLYAQARRNNDPDAEIEALRVRDELHEGLNNLKGLRQRAAHQARERQASAAQPQTGDPEAVARAREWARENPWFDPNLRDEDSAIAHAVEQRLFREGRLNPRLDDYWDEVTRRVARRLPEKYSNGRDPDDAEELDRAPPQRNGRDPEPRRRNGGPTFKVGGRERALRAGEVYIDEDRKQAMIEKGVWEDPVLRERQLKYYQQYDRDAGRRPR